jgi:hypothetical protein
LPWDTPPIAAAQLFQSREESARWNQLEKQGKT